MSFPRISIITPTLNRASYLERAILSVLSQNYPDLEYIVVDGGSNDGTLEILKKYSAEVQYVSEKDRGQSDAINKGLRIASGDILGYINSDDEYEPGALLHVGRFFQQNPSAFWLSGRCRLINERGNEILKPITAYKSLLLATRSRNLLLVVNYISQPATFWRREVLDSVGYFDTCLSAVMDYDYWLRISKQFRLFITHAYLAKFRLHSTSKTIESAIQEWDEETQMIQHYTRSKTLLFFHLLHRRLITKGYQRLLIKA
jgi:glycosyltransferase involved in cell wall biosynthesis